MTGQRRKARAIALQALYEIDTAKHQMEEVLNRLLSDENLTADNNAFVRGFVHDYTTTVISLTLGYFYKLPANRGLTNTYGASNNNEHTSVKAQQLRL